MMCVWCAHDHPLPAGKKQPVKKASSVQDLWEDELHAETESIHSHNPFVYDYLADTAKPGWSQEEDETLREMRLNAGAGTERQQMGTDGKKQEFVTDMVQTLHKQYSRSSLVASGGEWGKGAGCVCYCNFLFCASANVVLFHSQFRHQYWSEFGGATFFTPEFGLQQSLWRFSVQHR